jgi:ABC-type multidrug transport system ATPase subunit
MIFALISLRNYDILYLDEPTNHLDFTTKRIVSDILEDYQGTIVMVSHDRYFVNRVANKIIYLHDKNFIIEEGNYENFSSLHNISDGSFTFMLKKEQKVEKKEVVKKVSVNKDKEKAKIEKEIDKLMIELEVESENLSDSEKQYNWLEYKQMHDKIKEIEEKIEVLMLKLENLDA